MEAYGVANLVYIVSFQKMYHLSWLVKLKVKVGKKNLKHWGRRTAGSNKNIVECCIEVAYQIWMTYNNKKYLSKCSPSYARLQRITLLQKLETVVAPTKHSVKISHFDDPEKSWKNTNWDKLWNTSHRELYTEGVYQVSWS